MLDIVYAEERVLDKITIENGNCFKGYTTIGLSETGDYFIRLEFYNLSLDEMEFLGQLWNESKPLEIQSDLIEKEGYSISYIIVDKMKGNSEGEMIWECFSNDRYRAIA